MSARRRDTTRRARLAALLAMLASLPSLAIGEARGSGEIQPGAYCPIPQPGETPSCLEPARKEYGDFFSAVDEGKVDAESLERVERAVAAADGSASSYRALSSLAYGYWRLSERASGEEETHADITERLEQWNAVLGRAYDASAGDETFRAALREAALDLQQRAAPVRVACLDEQGRATECTSTDVVVRGLDTAASDVGLRGGLRRLIERWVGSDDS